MHTFPLLSLIILVCCVASCTDANHNTRGKYPTFDGKYPVTAKEDIVDTLHGTAVPDPYRWLEVDTAARVEAWVDEQNEETFSYLHAVPFRDKIMARYGELFNYAKY